MKIVLYAAILSILLAGASVATSGCGTFVGAGETPERVVCTLEKPCEATIDGKCVTYEGDSITLNCSRVSKSGNLETIEPLSGIKVTVTGYDDDNVLTGFVWAGELSKRGTYTFVPSLAGKYLIEAMLPSAKTANSIGANAGTTPYNAVIEVMENPNKAQNIITAAAAAVEEEEPAVVENASEETEPVVEDPIDVFAPKCHTDMSVIDFVMNVTETDRVKSDAPAIALMLVGFLIG